MTENAVGEETLGLDGIAPDIRNLGPYKLLVPGSYIKNPYSLIAYGTSPDTGNVVIKINRSSSWEADRDYAEEAVIHEHAQNIADNVVPLVGHGNIPLRLRYRETGTSFGVHLFPAVITEFMPRGDLSRHIYLSGTVTPEEAATMLFPTADTLDLLSRNGIVHGDVKPDNLLMNKRTPVLADFGEAVYDNTRTEYIVGADGYMDPEYVRTGVQRVHSNLYGLIATTLYMLKGTEMTFKNAKRGFNTLDGVDNRLEYKYRIFKELRGLRRPVALVYWQGLDRNPNNRPKSSVQFLVDLARAGSIPEQTIVDLKAKKA